tara:strand:- start:126 stop:770 length:645 start_codon:yes stop_codon:yes gene_type:complete
MNIPGYFKIYDVLSHYSSNDNKNIILEPLSCIFRMILLKYKETGTKISIDNNSICYNEPTYFQGIIRTYNGDTREDLHNLYNPFLKSFEWYQVNDTIYQYFYEKCKGGLNLLLESYEKDSIIYHTLNHYCKLFKDVLENKELCNEEQKESPLLEDLKDIWKRPEIEIVHQTFQYLETTQDEEEKQTYLKIIDDIVKMKEKKVYDYIHKYSTRYN